MTYDTGPVADCLYICTSCWQLFGTLGEWNDHADGPFANFEEARECRVEVDPGKTIPAGVRAGSGKCIFPDEDIDPAEWTDIEQDDIVYDDEAERVVGIVGHRDDETVDVEPLDGGTKTLQRDWFHPDGRYRAIRL